MNLLIDGLAVYRLARLVTRDRIAEPLRDAVSARSDLGDELVNCPHCVAVWAAAGVVAARVVCPRLWGPLGYGLAIAGVASLLADR